MRETINKHLINKIPDRSPDLILTYTNDLTGLKVYYEERFIVKYYGTVILEIHRDFILSELDDYVERINDKINTYERISNILGVSRTKEINKLKDRKKLIEDFLAEKILLEE